MTMVRVKTMFLFVAVMACVVQARTANQIQVEFQIFSFAEIPPGETFADERIWTTSEPPEKLKNIVTVFNRGWFELGENKLEFKDGRCFWNGGRLPIVGPKDVNIPPESIQLVYAPAIVMEEHSKRTLKVESKQPIQYFQKRDDGLFELKEVELPTGLDLEIEAKEEEEHGFIMLTDIVMTIRSVERRQKIPGVNLSVGHPFLGEQTYVFYFRVRPGKDYGILISPERGQGGLLIRLRASSTRSGTIPTKPRSRTN